MRGCDREVEIDIGYLVYMREDCEISVQYVLLVASRNFWAPNRETLRILITAIILSIFNDRSVPLEKDDEVATYHVINRARIQITR